MTVRFANRDDFERIPRDEGVLPPDWVTRRREVLSPDAERADPDANRHRVYEVDAGGPSRETPSARDAIRIPSPEEPTAPAPARAISFRLPSAVI